MNAILNSCVSNLDYLSHANDSNHIHHSSDIMEAAKIQFSTEELLLVQNSSLILTKNRIIEKLSQGLGHLVLQMQHEVKNRVLIHEAFDQSGPKLSRGEKYRGLPYLMLDYPRRFDKEHILAIRTFFWWGYFCSITLHVKGRYQLPVSKKISNSLDRLKGNGFYISLDGDEWDHDITGKAYHPLTAASANAAALQYSSFIKLSSKVEIGQWDVMEKELFERFIELLKLIED